MDIINKRRAERLFEDDFQDKYTQRQRGSGKS